MGAIFPCAMYNTLSQTPQKKKIPLLYGSNITVDSPDPMSKYNSSHPSNVCPMSKASSTVAKIMQNFEDEVPQPSPDSIMDDIYDFAPTSSNVGTTKLSSSSCRWKGESISEVLRSCSEIMPSEETEKSLHCPRNGSSFPAGEDDGGILFEKTLEDNIATLRRQRSRAEGGDMLSRPGTGMGPASRVVRTGGGRLLKPAMRSLEQLPSSASPSPLPTRETDVKAERSSKGHPRETTPIRKQMPTSRSLDTLSTPLLDHIEEESANTHSSPILTKPTPPPPVTGARASAPPRKNARLHPTPPASAPTDITAVHSDCTPPTNASNHASGRSKGRTYRPRNMGKEVEDSVGASDLDRDFSQELCNDHLQTESVKVAPGGESREKDDGILPVKEFITQKQRQRDPHVGRTVTVSGCSRALMTQLLAKASRRRKKRSKHALFFTPRLETIPEDRELSSVSSRMNPLDRTTRIDTSTLVLSSGNHESEKDTSGEAVNDVDPEYVEWLLSQGNASSEDRGNSELYAFFSSIRSNDGPLFKEMLASNPNLVYGRDSNGNTALILSTIVGWRKGIKLLIKRGADVNSQNRFGNTCLHFAHAMDGSGDIQRYLMKKTASDKIRNERGLCCDIRNIADMTIACSGIAMI